MWVVRSQKYGGNTEQNYNPFIFNNYSLNGDARNVSCTSAQLILILKFYQILIY